MPKARTESEIRTISEDVSDGGDQVLSARIDDLETQVQELEGDIASLRALTVETADTVVGNAEIANKNELARATQEGRCGTRLVQDGPGIIRNEKIPCTAKVLWPD